MRFGDLDVGDVFVLRWWLNTGPTPRHYLVVRREDDRIWILRLEEDDHKLVEVDRAVFEECLDGRDVCVSHVYKATRSSPANGQ